MDSPDSAPADDPSAPRAAQAIPAGPLFAQQTVDFLATLAHELRSPLAPLRNGLYILRKPHNAAIEARTLDMLERQLTHLSRLVEDLLDVARLRTGKLDLQREHLDLREVIAHALEISQPAIDEAGHQLEVQVPPDALPVDGDRTRLCQVLSNLLNNAAKFTPRRGHIRVHARREAQHAEVSVTDDGVGMTPQIHAHAFEMFRQEQPGAGGGLGIGLALVSALVGMHGGEVDAASDGPGKGSTFTVRLPLAASVMQA